MALGELHGRNLASALMRSRFHNRTRDRGGKPIRLAWLWALPPVLPEGPWALQKLGNSKVEGEYRRYAPCTPIRLCRLRTDRRLNIHQRDDYPRHSVLEYSLPENLRARHVYMPHAGLTDVHA
jgi:hypothetical protein